MFHENHLREYDYDQQLLIKYYQSMAVESMVNFIRALKIKLCANLKKKLNSIFRLHTTATAVSPSSFTVSPIQRQDKTVCLSDGEKLANQWKPLDASVLNSADRKT